MFLFFWIISPHEFLTLCPKSKEYRNKFWNSSRPKSIKRSQTTVDQRCLCLTIRQNLQIKGIFISKYCVADLQVRPMTQLYEVDNVKASTGKGYFWIWNYVHHLDTHFLWQFTNMCLLPNLKISIWFWTVTAHLKMQIRRYFGKGIHKILNCLETPIKVLL